MGISLEHERTLDHVRLRGFQESPAEAASLLGSLEGERVQDRRARRHSGALEPFRREGQGAEWPGTGGKVAWDAFMDGHDSSL